MLVKLKNTWYAPDGRLYKRQAKGTVIPDSLKNALPTGAEILDQGKDEPKKEEPKTEAKK